MQNTDGSVSKFFIPALLISFFAVTLSVPMLSILTVDMTQTFLGNLEPSAIAQVAQVSTVNRAAEVLFALAMGALTVRFKSKPLLLLGVIFLLVSAVGSFFAPTLSYFQLFYVLEGGGSVIVAITALTLIGDLLSTKQKPKVISYINAAGSAAILIAAPAISIITNLYGWKLNYIWLVLPLSMVGLALAFIGLPAKQAVHDSSKQSYYKGYKEVLKNKSAVACLIAGMCGTAGNLAVFSIAFYRLQFLSNAPVADQVNFGTMILMVAAAMLVIASIVMGRLLSRISAIVLTVIGMVGNGVFTALFFAVPNLSIAIGFHILQIWFFAMAVTPWSVLALDQVPAFRGTMMSLRTIVISIGSAISIAAGGIALTFGSYQLLGLVLGAIILPGAPLIYFYTKDPNRAIA